MDLLTNNQRYIQFQVLILRRPLINLKQALKPFKEREDSKPSWNKTVIEPNTGVEDSIMYKKQVIKSKEIKTNLKRK